MLAYPSACIELALRKPTLVTIIVEVLGTAVSYVAVTVFLVSDRQLQAEDVCDSS